MTTRRLLLLAVVSTLLAGAPAAFAHPMRDYDDRDGMVPYALPGGLPGVGAPFASTKGRTGTCRRSTKACAWSARPR